jgi:Na+-transporting methylmalonyl-CoA/oxaloacetate decarboxylase beta subunit
MSKNNRIIIIIGIKIIILLIAVILNYLILKYLGTEFKEASAVVVGGSEDGPTTIYISSTHIMMNILKFTPSIIIGINLLMFIVFDILEIVKRKFYDRRNKLKIILGINLRIIITSLVEIIVYSAIPALSIFGNIILISIFLIIMYLKRIKSNK